MHDNIYEDKIQGIVENVVFYNTTKKYCLFQVFKIPLIFKNLFYYETIINTLPITEEGFLISSCYSLELCIQMFMAIIKKSTNNNCWREHGEKGTLLHC